MSRDGPAFTVISPGSADNSLGRALCVAATLEGLGPVRVVTLDTGALWVGHASWDITVEVFSTLRALADAVANAPPSREMVLVAIKPLPTSLGTAAVLARRLRRAGLRAWLVADLDEDDLALRRASLHRLGRRGEARLQVEWLRRPLPGHPVLVAGLLRWVLPRADLAMVSSHALGAACVPAGLPIVRLPHARAARPLLGVSDHVRLRIGFFGTLRGYKGAGALRSILVADEALELHLLGDRDRDRMLPELGDAVAARVVMHPQRGLDTLAQAHRAVDVALVPQDPQALQTSLQLPAKLVDAMTFGRPIVATDTPPIVEIGGDTILTVSTWDPLDQALAHLRRLRDAATREELGRRAHARANAELTIEPLSRLVGDGLRQIGVRLP